MLYFFFLIKAFSSVQFSRSVVSDSLRPHESQHARPPSPSPTPGVHPNSCPSSWWCHPAISSSVLLFSSCPQSLPASGSFPMSQLFTWSGQSIGVSASASVLPMNTQDWLIYNVMLTSAVQQSDSDIYWAGQKVCLNFPISYWKIQMNFNFFGLPMYVVLEKAMAPHSSTLAWKIPWMEKPGRLQSLGSLRVRHDWATSLSLFTFVNWRGKWQPTPVFLPGESRGPGGLMGCRLWGHTESDTTEVT